MQERRARERDQRRRLIVTTARDLAEAEGWDAVTTRRLADAIEYSQPVLYSHFSGKDAIVRAVALDGFAELTAILRAARAGAPTPTAALSALAHAYVQFAQARPALYEAMFALADLPFAQPDTPAELREAFAELSITLAPLAGDRDLETLAEVTWSAVHGLIALARSGRLRPDHTEQRLALLVDQTITAGRHLPRCPE